MMEKKYEEENFNEENFNLKSTILIILLCLLFILVVFLIFNFKSLFRNETSSELYSVNVSGYSLDNEFNSDIYKYNLVVNDNIIDISCESKLEIEGCNTQLDLTGKENYIHEIKVSENKIYTINIKNQTNIEDETLSIKTINGNTFEWTNKDVNLEVIMSDKGEYSYSIDGGKTWQQNNKFTIKENGIFEIVVKNSDGVLSELKKVEVDKIDKLKPHFTINKFGDEDKVILEISAYDELSGIDSISFNGGNFSTNVKYEVTKVGKYYFEVKDKAGNISDKQYVEVNDSDLKKKEESKTYTLTLKSNGVQVEKGSVSCTTTSDSCEVILPRIITNYSIVGWGESKSSTTAKYNQGQIIKLNSNLTLYAITKQTYTATFNKNGAKKIGQTSLRCEAYNGGTCSVNAPTITTDGTVIGWNKSSNSTTASIRENGTIQLNKNTTYYAITKNTYIASFNKNGAKSIGNDILKCTAYNAGTCEVVAPTITSSWDIVGWNTSSDDKKASVKVNDTIVLNRNTTYYAITRRNYKVEYNKNAATSISKGRDECIAYNGGTCSVKAPTITTKGTAIGWSINKSATTASVKENGTITLSGNVTYYAITKQTYTATFYNNGLDYLEHNTLSCDVYNGDSGCNITLPYFNKKGYYSMYWSPSSLTLNSLFGTTKKDEYFKSVGNSYKLTKDITLYPNYNYLYYNDTTTNLHKFRNFNIEKSINIGNTIFEFQEGIPLFARNQFIETMKGVYSKYPFLFRTGKVFVLTEETYSNYSRAYAITYGPYAYFHIDLQFDLDEGDNGGISINGALHELAHGWDRYYSYKKGKRICDLDEFDELYNIVYNRLHIESDGSRLSKAETFVSLFTNYYWHILGNDTSKPWYGLDDRKIPLNEYQKKKVKEFMEKYINISKSSL